MDVDQVYCQKHHCHDVADHKVTKIFLVEQCPPNEHRTDADIGPEYPSEAIEVTKDKPQGRNKSPDDNVMEGIDIYGESDVCHFIQQLEVEEPFKQARPLEAGGEIEHASYSLHDDHNLEVGEQFLCKL